MTQTALLRERIEALPRWPVFAEEGEPARYGRLVQLDDVLAIFAPAPVPPPGTRLVLMSDELMDVLAYPTKDRSVTWQWGEPDEHGWYSPTFTAHRTPEPPARPDCTVAFMGGAECQRDAGLDAALLAEALHEMEGPGKHNRPRYTRQICPGPGHHIREAEVTIAEYDRLRVYGELDDHTDDEPAPRGRAAGEIAGDR